MVDAQQNESFATLDEALASPGISVKHRARLSVLAARTRLYFGQPEEAGREAENALASATAAQDTWATGWALQVLATKAALEGDPAAALPLYERGLAVTETDPALTDLGLLLQVNKAMMLGTMDRWDDALKTAERAQQQADQVGTTVRQMQAHGALGQALYEMGRWDDALTELTAMPDNLKDPFSACIELSLAALISFHRGDGATARRALADADLHTERIGPYGVPSLLLARSLDRELAGAADEAKTILTEATNEATDIGNLEDVLDDALRLALKTGDKETAQTIARHATVHAAGSEIPHRQASALYCRGLVDRDSSVLLAAARRYADAGRPLPRAKALEAAAECLVEADDRTAARQAFEQAVEVYEALGAEADLNRVQAEFRGHGIRRGPHSKHRRAVRDRGAAHAVPADRRDARLAHPEEAGRGHEDRYRAGVRAADRHEPVASRPPGQAKRGGPSETRRRARVWDLARRLAHARTAALQERARGSRRVPSGAAGSPPAVPAWVSAGGFRFPRPGRSAPSGRGGQPGTTSPAPGCGPGSRG
jgi:tetratricopeptide (TPR) repeat protein